MGDYEHMIARQRKWMLYLFVLLFIGAFITPYKRIFFGLLLGHVASYYSLRSLQRNIRKFGKAVINEGSPIGLGTFFRLIITGLAIFIAFKFEEEIHIIAVVIGLVTSYVIIVIDQIFRTVAENKK